MASVPKGGTDIATSRSSGAPQSGRQRHQVHRYSEVCVIAVAVNGHFAVSVTDTGPGIRGASGADFRQFHQVDGSNTKVRAAPVWASPSARAGKACGCLAGTAELPHMVPTFRPERLQQRIECREAPTRSPRRRGLAGPAALPSQALSLPLD
jgi:hypothetical protein